MSWQDEFVQVVNETDEPLEWDGDTYQPAQRRTVPYLNMINTFGDPRSVRGRHQIYMASNGERGVIQPREVELNRVMTFWKDPANPKLSFYTMDGDRLWTVADDPFGEKSTPAPPSIEEAQMLQNTIIRQQQQIDQLLQVAGLTKDALPDSDKGPADIPADIPVDDSTAKDTQSPWAHSKAIND